jgi:hypothetical protein
MTAMTSTIERELDALRKELAALRSDREAHKRTDMPEQTTEGAPGQTEPSAIQQLAAETRALLDAARDDIAIHPVASIVGALIAGVLLGALIRN